MLKTVGPNIFDVFAPPFPLAGELQLPVTTLLINKQIALMSMPGEPYVDFQMNWREHAPYAMPCSWATRMGISVISPQFAPRQRVVMGHPAP